MKGRQFVRFLNFCVTFMVVFLSGCAAHGPFTISAARPDYNQAIQKTNDQELLLNLVRIAYTDTTFFTAVDRVAASYEINRNVSVKNFSDIGGLGSLGVGDLSLGVNELPTIFYSPVDGEKFVRQMLTPMDPDLLLLLVKSGWPLDKVFALAVQEMNGLRNAPSAAGPRPESEPIFRDFKEVTRLLRVLQNAALIEFRKDSDAAGIEILFLTSKAHSAELLRVKELLRLKLDLDRFPLIAGADNKDPSKIAISTRPLMSTLSYLAQGVEPPNADLDAGFIRTTRRADGSPFDWQDLLKGVFMVKSMATLPQRASVVIPYRNSYFYIADEDLESKATFVLLNQLMALSSGSGNNANAINYMFGKTPRSKSQQ